MQSSITINTDGSCHGNPGPGGYAAIIEIPNHDPITVRGGEADTTNNRMEMLAVINGLKELTELADVSGVPITIRTDSEYVANAFNKGWLEHWQRNGWKTSGRKPVKNQELWQEMLKAVRGLELSFVHVRGHAGDPGNEACDRIANEEAERAGRTGQDQAASAEVDWQAGPERPEAPEEKNKPDGTRGAEDAFSSGYELCRLEILDFLERTGESPHPPHWNYTDGFKDCRSRLRQFLDRMEKPAAARPPATAHRDQGRERPREGQPPL